MNTLRIVRHLTNAVVSLLGYPQTVGTSLRGRMLS